jgi:hypothetical protein
MILGRRGPLHHSKCRDHGVNFMAECDRREQAHRMMLGRNHEAISGPRLRPLILKPPRAERQNASCPGMMHLKLVPRRGLEPPRPCERQHLKLVRLPIPPSGHRCLKSSGRSAPIGVRFVLVNRPGPGHWRIQAQIGRLSLDDAIDNNIRR